MDQYLPILTMLVLAIVFAVGSFVASGLLAPKARSAAKEAPYECGIVPTREPPERFPVRFYVVAMLFIIFDIEIIFLYPWAVSYGALGVAGFFEMVAFAATVFVSLLYVIAKGSLEWGSRAQIRTSDEGVHEPRTSTSTIRRVSNQDLEAA